MSAGGNAQERPVADEKTVRLVASTLLTPLEAARIRLVSSKGYANGLVGAVGRMAKEGGLGEFYGACSAQSLLPLPRR